MQLYVRGTGAASLSLENAFNHQVQWLTNLQEQTFIEFMMKLLSSQLLMGRTVA